MSLTDLLSELSTLTLKTQQSTYPSEFILPYVTKRRILSQIESYRYSENPTSDELSLLKDLLTYMNQYEYYDPVLLNLFDYLCKHVSKEELTNCSFIKRYTCPDVVPQPYYGLIKKSVTEQGMVVGNMNHGNVDVITMIGKMIGYVIYEQDRVLCYHMETPLLSAMYQKITKRNI